MSDMTILSQMIKRTALISCEGSEKRPRVTLREPQAKDSSATISHLPSDVLVIKVDVFNSTAGIFNGNNGECKLADYVIISETKKCIIYH